jgi:dolichol kinase
MARKKIKPIILIGLLLIILSFFLDDIFAKEMKLIRTDALTSIMYFVTDFALIFLFIIAIFKSILLKKYRFILFIFLCAGIAFETAFLLKLVFKVPRPYLLNYEEAIFLVSGYSFPSVHASFIGSLIPFQKYLFSRWRITFIFLLMFLVVFSRVYLGVHNLSDVITGLFIGLFCTYAFLTIEKKYKIIEWFKMEVGDKLELRRQTAHLLIGISIVLLLKLQILNVFILFLITLIGGILVLIARKKRLPIIHTLLEYFERPHHMARFPGRGSFFLFLGASLTVMIFERNIAMAAIMIMAIGDSVTNIVGRHFGKIKNPFNYKKNIEGTFAAIVFATLGAFFFVPFWPAFIASAISMFVESIDLGWKKYEIEIDDNVVIPLIAGAVITMMV